MCGPSPESVTVVLQLPSAATVAVPIAVVPSNTVTVVPTTGDCALNVPLIVWSGVLVKPPLLVRVRIGIAVSTVGADAPAALYVPNGSVVGALAPPVL